MSVLGITVLRSAKGVRISFTGIKVFTKLGVESRAANSPESCRNDPPTVSANRASTSIAMPLSLASTGPDCAVGVCECGGSAEDHQQGHAGIDMYFA
jgi:hypothetical protein